MQSNDKHFYVLKKKISNNMQLEMFRFNLKLCTIYW